MEGERTQEHRACLRHISDRKATQRIDSVYPKVRIAEGGQLMEIQMPKIQSMQQGGALRGNIEGFSKNSRRRLQRKTASINEWACGLPDFLTLTYPGEYSKDWREWKRHLHNFIKALVRRWPEVWGVWRLEFQERGAPHFHFLLWDGPEVEGVQVWSHTKRKMITIAVPGTSSAHNEEVFSWISTTWYRIVDSGDPRHLNAGTRVEPIESWNGVRFYVSKYLAKLQEGNFVPEYCKGTGRFWGVIQADRWKVNFFEQDLPLPMTIKVRRIIRKRLENLKRLGKSKWDPWAMRTRIINGMSTFLDSRMAHRLIEWAWQETGGCPF